jgi:deoxyribodipyrimidine photolyase
METAIVVFTRDLRLHDNPALHQACTRARQVVPLFVVDPANTRPNRVMNPLRQAERFDPAGEYVRRYVPELAGLSPARVHTPWRLDPATRRTLSYPDPLVDLS